MFMAAAHTLANLVDAGDLAQGSLYPALALVREVSLHIAVAVATIAFKEGLAGVPQPSDVTGWVRSQMYEPRYASYVSN
jgi:malate dehydrogenase (oxaloacetate-decarboxylating)(NADP+)